MILIFSIDQMTLECHVIEGTSRDSSAIEVSWTVHNGTLCSHLEGVSLERFNITLEAAVRGSSLMSKLGSVTLPLASTALHISYLSLMILYSFSDYRTVHFQKYFFG